jgi:ClpP class serine protease
MLIYEITKKIFILLLMLFYLPYLVQGVMRHYHVFYEQKTALGVVSFDDPITTSCNYNKHLTSFFRNPDIGAIVLVMNNTKQGSLGAAYIIAHTIEHLKKEYPKPVIAFIENVCSGPSYLIASAADSIVASGMAVIMPIDTSSLHSTIADLCGQELYDDCAQSIHEQLVTFIAYTRKLPFAVVNSYIPNTPLSAAQAKKLGFIDDSGGIQTVHALIEKKSLIQGPLEWTYPEQSLSHSLTAECMKLISFFATYVSHRHHWSTQETLGEE